ncbi:MAG: hypothetical protein COV73_01035 [Candidatus Omnitrophica bacterium CG11_big_fil_rev_8_21_14_0_20_43_6]|nr:MAG: hypothetical protein COV73_01035 [Candidatus Omnitrophica bacterium CG11_big_fil_rev_8_21_14_0_20_43_6]
MAPRAERAPVFPVHRSALLGQASLGAPLGRGFELMQCVSGAVGGCGRVGAAAATASSPTRKK